MARSFGTMASGAALRPLVSQLCVREKSERRRLHPRTIVATATSESFASKLSNATKALVAQRRQQTRKAAGKRAEQPRERYLRLARRERTKSD
jgi:hypothetical protein